LCGTANGGIGGQGKEKYEQTKQAPRGEYKGGREKRKKIAGGGEREIEGLNRTGQKTGMGLPGKRRGKGKRGQNDLTS